MMTEYHIEYKTKEGDLITKTEVHEDMDTARYLIPRFATDIYIKSLRKVEPKPTTIPIVSPVDDDWWDYAF